MLHDLLPTLSILLLQLVEFRNQLSFLYLFSSVYRLEMFSLLFIFHVQLVLHLIMLFFYILVACLRFGNLTKVVFMLFIFLLFKLLLVLANRLHFLFNRFVQFNRVIFKLFLFEHLMSLLFINHLTGHVFSLLHFESQLVFVTKFVCFETVEKTVQVCDSFLKFTNIMDNAFLRLI